MVWIKLLSVYTVVLQKENACHFILLFNTETTEKMRSADLNQSIPNINEFIMQLCIT